MNEISLVKRVKYAGDIHTELLKSGWDLDTATTFVNNIPDADVAQVRHGRWKFVKKVGVTNTYKCSLCGRIEFINESIFYNMKEKIKELYPYCHCGAKMDGGAENG